MCVVRITILSVILLFYGHVDSARILAMVPTPSYSHQIVFQPLWKELSLRGHQVTLITTDPIKNSSLTNLTEIDVHDAAYELWNERFEGKFEKENMDPLTFFTMLHEIIIDLTDLELQQPKVRDLIANETEHFDLVMVEYFSPVICALSKRFNSPLIFLQSMDPFNSILHLVGNPGHPVLNPYFGLAFEEKLTFFERVRSTLLQVVGEILYYGYYRERYLASMDKFYTPDYRTSIKDVIQNMSLFFINTDQIYARMRPLNPNIIQIGGGMHMESTQPLPKDLKKYLDDAKEGVIYFSLGTNIKSKDLQQKTLNTLLETFAELPYKVLWKFELEKIPNQPANIYTSKWFPQQDVLRHPNIKLFIMQGGLQSIEEALHSRVPLIGMPFFADQPGNVKRLTVKGIGLAVDHNTLEKKDFKSKIIEVIENPKYKERVTELSNLMVDQPMTGLERAVWWTEYVIRHKGAKHFKSPSIDLPLYQYFLLDVIGFCLIVILLTLYIIVKIFKLLFKFLNYIFNRQKDKLD